MIPERFQATIAAQWANSPVLMALLENINEYMDQRWSLDLFYRDVWDVSQAQGYGLDVWGRIVGVGRSFTYKSVTYTLADSDFRTLVLVKAMANICDSSAPSYNRLLTALLEGLGRAYVVDTGGMTMAVVLEFLLTPTEEATLVGSGVFPHPGGVGTYIAPVPPGLYFGFEGSSGVPFGHGPFFPGVIDA